MVGLEELSSKLGLSQLPCKAMDGRYGRMQARESYQSTEEDSWGEVRWGVYLRGGECNMEPHSCKSKAEKQVRLMASTPPLGRSMGAIKLVFLMDRAGIATPVVRSNQVHFSLVVIAANPDNRASNSGQVD